jgi:zinc transporter ZupT
VPTFFLVPMNLCVSASVDCKPQVRKPDDATLAFLLGLAYGVMLTLSVVELWAKNAIENGWVMVTAATLAGAALYYFVQPLFPEFEVCSCCRWSRIVPW